MDSDTRVSTADNHILYAQWDPISGYTVYYDYNDITSVHWAYANIIEASFEHEYTRDYSKNELWKSWK